jgi:hypothetical protein
LRNRRATAAAAAASMIHIEELELLPDGAMFTEPNATGPVVCCVEVVLEAEPESPKLISLA